MKLWIRRLRLKQKRTGFSITYSRTKQPPVGTDGRNAYCSPFPPFFWGTTSSYQSDAACTLGHPNSLSWLVDSDCSFANAFSVWLLFETISVYAVMANGYGFTTLSKRRSRYDRVWFAIFESIWTKMIKHGRFGWRAATVLLPNKYL